MFDCNHRIKGYDMEKFFFKAKVFYNFVNNKRSILDWYMIVFVNWLYMLFCVHSKHILFNKFQNIMVMGVFTKYGIQTRLSYIAYYYLHDILVDRFNHCLSQLMSQILLKDLWFHVMYKTTCMLPIQMIPFSFKRSSSKP